MITLEKWGIWKVRYIQSELAFREGWCERPCSGVSGMDFKRIELNSEEAARTLAEHYTNVAKESSQPIPVRFSAKKITDQK